VLVWFFLKYKESSFLTLQIADLRKMLIAAIAQMWIELKVNNGWLQ